MQEIFEKRDFSQDSTGAKKRPPLTASQKRRIQKAKHYKELHKQQEEKAKEHAKMSKALRPCKYYQLGNCNKASFLQIMTTFLVFYLAVAVDRRQVKVFSIIVKHCAVQCAGKMS